MVAALAAPAALHVSYSREHRPDTISLSNQLEKKTASRCARAAMTGEPTRSATASQQISPKLSLDQLRSGRRRRAPRRKRRYLRAPWRSDARAKVRGPIRLTIRRGRRAGRTARTHVHARKARSLALGRRRR